MVITGRVQKMTNLAKQAESLDAKKKHMQAFVDKFRFNAKRASLVQSRLKAIERLGGVQLGVCCSFATFKPLDFAPATDCMKKNSFENFLLKRLFRVSCPGELWRAV